MTPVPPLATGNVPVTPVVNGKPVALVNVTADGVPKLGVTITGELENRMLPVPVSSVTALARLTDEGVAKNVAIPAPKPLTPVAIGKPVAFVNVATDGIPIFGVVKIGLVNVLFVNVSVPAMVANVPVADGSVIVVVPANFLLFDKYEIGGTYRLDDSFGAIVNFAVTPSIRIGYAYDHVISEIKNTAPASHEFILLFDLNLSKKVSVSPRFF